MARYRKEVMKECTKSYLLNMTEEEHRLLKTRSAMMGISIKELIILSVRTLIEKGLAK